MCVSDAFPLRDRLCPTADQLRIGRPNVFGPAVDGDPGAIGVDLRRELGRQHDVGAPSRNRAADQLLVVAEPAHRYTPVMSEAP